MGSRFKARAASEVTAELELFAPCDGWFLTVKYIPPAQERAMSQQASAAGGNRDARFQELFTEAALVGWRGCTPSKVSALVELDPTGDALEVDGNGEVPFNLELAKFLMDEAPDFMFRNPIAKLARTLLQQQALVKKTESSGSGA